MELKNWGYWCVWLICLRPVLMDSSPLIGCCTFSAVFQFAGKRKVSGGWTGVYYCRFEGYGCMEGGRGEMRGGRYPAASNDGIGDVKYETTDAVHEK